ncbi:MAG: protein translocase subunit SecD [Calditrichaeota bacterium]|nr:protein translocase subunit SecD [Calditrichota bacterium]
MKQYRFRIIVVLILIVLGGYLLYPTLRYDQLTTKEGELLTKLSAESGIPLSRLALDIYRDDVDLIGEIQQSDLSEMAKSSAIEQVEYLRGDFSRSLQANRSLAIKRGLDLQGGMYLVLEVDLVELLENSAKGKDDQYEALMRDVRTESKDPAVEVFDALESVSQRMNITLSRYWGEPGQSDEDVLSQLRETSDDAIDRSLEILRNRVDQFGVSEPSISKLGTHRIALELPGVKDPLRARELVGRTALLEFNLVAETDRTQEVLTTLDDAIARRMKGDTSDVATEQDSTIADTAAADTTAKENLAADTANADSGTSAQDLFAEADSLTPEVTSDTENPLLSLLVGGTGDILVPAENRAQVTRYIASHENQRHIPRDLKFVWSARPEKIGADVRDFWRLYLVKARAEMTGDKLADARSTMGSGYDPNQAGKPVVTIEFTREGGRVFSRVTGANVGRRLAITLDDKIYMAPNLREKISGGSAVITGLDDMEESRDIAIVLRAGALPASVDVVEERTVGPSLGTDSVEAGKLSLTLAFLAVTLFMLIYYRMSGGIADIAMILNVFLLLAALALFQFTLTMPGIAGIILTIGMAVDANVLIFERIREELRLGKTVRAAVDAGFERAIVTIIDANVTTAIAGVVLLVYGTGPIKGFALTLTIGILINLFAAIFFTRLVYDLWIGRRQVQTISI